MSETKLFEGVDFDAEGDNQDEVEQLVVSRDQLLEACWGAFLESEGTAHMLEMNEETNTLHYKTGGRFEDDTINPYEVCEYVAFDADLADTNRHKALISFEGVKDDEVEIGDEKYEVLLR